jgi:hypothetical protein
MARCRFIPAVASCFVATAVAQPALPQTSREAVRQYEVDRQQPLWRSVAHANPADKVGSRQLMGYALALAEARQNPERLERLFALLARMQDRERSSSTFGHLKWRWGDADVSDLNAVEFCMHDAALLWKRHGNWMPPEGRELLLALMRFGLEAVRRHQVKITYTNIALTQAGNLLLLGEILNSPEAVEAGVRRLDDLYRWTTAHGVHECVSPTYYAVDINALLLIATCSQNQQASGQAKALLQLLWTDMALNWFPAAERLSGATSRTYDYRAGRGALDWHLWVNGWFESARPGKAERAEPYWNEWTPTEELRSLSRQHLPRLVRQRWGEHMAQSRTYMAYPDIGLSTLGAAYGAEDIPLAIDLPATREAPRGYFRADGRDNPYGDQKFAVGPGRQLKPNHLTPFWMAAQREGDALAVAIFDARTGEAESRQAHLVLPRQVRSIFVAGAPAELTAAGGAARWPIPGGEAVVLRYAAAAVGIRVWSATSGGSVAQQPESAVPMALIDDANSYGCIRITADLGRAERTGPQNGALPWPAVVLWIRVGSNLADDAAFAAWQQEFTQAKAGKLALTQAGVEVEVPGAKGPLAVTATFDKRQQAVARRIVPEPTRCLLELDGKEVGLPLLTGRDAQRDVSQNDDFLSKEE